MPWVEYCHAVACETESYAPRRRRRGRVGGAVIDTGPGDDESPSPAASSDTESPPAVGPPVVRSAEPETSRPVDPRDEPAAQPDQSNQLDQLDRPDEEGDRGDES